MEEPFDPQVEMPDHSVSDDRDDQVDDDDQEKEEKDNLPHFIGDC